MLGVLRVSTGNGPNGLTLQSQFLQVLPRAARAVSPLRARGRCCQHRARCPGGWRGHWGQGQAVMQHCHRHLLPSAKLCLPVCFRLKTHSSGEDLHQNHKVCPPRKDFGRKQIPLCKTSFPDSICSSQRRCLEQWWCCSSRSSLAWHPLRGRGSIESRSQGCSEDQTRMQTLNPNLSTQPEAPRRGDCLFQAQSEALGEPHC